MCTFQNPFQKLVLIPQIIHIPFFVLAHVLIDVPSHKLILETMDSPPNVCRQGSINFVVLGFGPPNELSFVLEENVLIGSLDEVAFYAEMGEDGKGALGVTEGISCDSYFGVVVELLLQEVQT